MAALGAGAATITLAALPVAGLWAVLGVALGRRQEEMAHESWAADCDIESWGQYFLKFLLGHPAVTCSIPGTSSPKHLTDNMGAGYGELPDEKTRRRMIAHLGL